METTFPPLNLQELIRVPFGDATFSERVRVMDMHLVWAEDQVLLRRRMSRMRSMESMPA